MAIDWVHEAFLNRQLANHYREALEAIVRDHPFYSPAPEALIARRMHDTAAYALANTPEGTHP